MNTTADIPLGAGLRRIVDTLTGMVSDGVRAIMKRYGTPDEARRTRGDVFADVGFALTRLRRMTRILRYVFVMLAIFFEPPPAKARAAARTPSAPRPPGSRRACFQVAAPYRPRWVVDGEETAPQPNPFAGCARNPMTTLARYSEALSRALAAPMTHVRRLARILRRDACFIAWHRASKPPRRAEREFWEELVEAAVEARFQLSEFYRRRRDSG